MNLGVQYYRPPFPVKKHWVDDFKRIRDCGLNAVQLWVLWGWVEPRPGEFIYDDYDRLVELAHKNGLGVVLSTIAEIQPHWIHRQVPGSEMIDHMGRAVVSSNRHECHFGITPGGCTDHPGVWERMAEFLRQTVNRYKDAPHLVGWDAWNELRWNVEADGLVCFCPHSLAAFRKWLDGRYGRLDALNAAWLRRYGDWSEVMPGKLPDRPYTEMMAWEHFVTAKCGRHGQARFDLMKSLDSKHPVTVHAATPSPLMAGGPENYAIDRGNDWFFADGMDGVGCSSFPKWGRLDDADFGMRVEFVKSAARDKRVWLSEVQGGRANVGFDISTPVDALSQQRWIWNGLACGAETILFWCWRDEVFGRESGGFGIIGRDGLADERIAALKAASRLIRENRGLIDNYRPARPSVGVLFSPQAYYLGWAQEGNAKRFRDALAGYARSLVRKSIPYLVVEEEHLDALKGLKVLFMPRGIVTGPAIEKRLAAFVRNGGTLVCESECGAFSPQGIYRYPEERFLARLTGVCEVGRRQIGGGAFEVAIGGRKLKLEGVQWVTPMVAMHAKPSARKGKLPGRSLAAHLDGSLVHEAPVGKGCVILVGGYLGDAYLRNWNGDFEEFVELIVREAGWAPDIQVVSPALGKESFLYVKSGLSGKTRMVFVFFQPGHDLARLRFAPGVFASGQATDLITGERVDLADAAGGKECILAAPDLRISVLAGS